MNAEKTKDKNADSSKILKFLELICSEKFFYYYIVSVMILIPVSELISEIIGQPFAAQPIILQIYGIAGMLPSFASLLYKRSEKKVYPSDVFFILLIIFAAISLFCSKDFINSALGFHYDELPAHFLAYFSLMFAGTMINDDKLRKKVLLTFCIVGALQGVVALFQTFGLRIADSFFDPEWHRNSNLSFGLTQHNNWFAGLSTIFAAAAIGMFVFTAKKKKISYVYLALAAISIYVSFCTEARIAWVGNAAVILFYIVSLIVMKRKDAKNPDIKSYILSFLVIIAVYIAVIAIIILTRDTFLSGIEELMHESSAGFDELGNHRGYIWRFGLESVPANWLTGVGLDNYIYAFTSNPEWSQGMFSQAKGHNEYIHTLVTQGVFAAINYILLLVYSFVTGVKNVIKTNDDNKRKVTWIFLGMFIGYAAQAFFNSSVINVAMYFWIVVGMTMPKASQKPLKLFGKSH